MPGAPSERVHALLNRTIEGGRTPAATAGAPRVTRDKGARWLPEEIGAAIDEILAEAAEGVESLRSALRRFAERIADDLPEVLSVLNQVQRPVTPAAIPSDAGSNLTLPAICHYPAIPLWPVSELQSNLAPNQGDVYESPRHHTGSETVPL